MEWIWDGYVRAEMLTMLAGDPKVGKTTLLEGLLRAVARGEDFLGQATSPATAVVVGEDTAWEFEEREGLLGPAPDRRLVLGEFATTADEWDAIVEGAVDACESGGHGLLVVDSFPKLTGLGQSELENDAAVVGRHLHPLWVATRRHGLAVVFTHHLSRRGRARGSTAFEGTPDTLVRLHRREKQTAFDVRAKGRSQRTPAHVRGNLDVGASPWRYEATGAGESGDRAAVWAALEAAGPKGATVKELEAASGVADKTVRRALQGYSGKPGWLAAGRVKRLGSGRAGDGFRYAEKSRSRTSPPLHTHKDLHTHKAEKIQPPEHVPDDPLCVCDECMD